MAESIAPRDLFFTPCHQWLRPDEERKLVVVGVTDYFQKRMEEIIHVERPPEGERVIAGEPIFLIESGKTVWEFTAPVSGVVKEVNEFVLEMPEMINEDPYGRGWILTIAVSDADWSTFMSAEEYENFLLTYNYPYPPM